MKAVEGAMSFHNALVSTCSSYGQHLAALAEENAQLRAALVEREKTSSAKDARIEALEGEVRSLRATVESHREAPARTPKKGEVLF